MTRSASSLALGLAAALLASCAGTELHLHDRHVLSYPLVEAYAKAHPGTRLVLLDYHHDVGPLGERVSSANWVGALLQKGLLSEVLWVSGRGLSLPDRDARRAWLRRKLDALPEGTAAAIGSRIRLADWAELEGRRLAGPCVVSLDLDLLAHDPGDPPEGFLGEIADWVALQRPALVTVALSAAYEPEPGEAWSWLEAFVRRFGGASPKPALFLEAGDYSVMPEGLEEYRAWEGWRADPATFAARGAAFWPGAAIWTEAPRGLRELLLSLGARAGDAASADILSGWRDPDRALLEEGFGEAGTEALLRTGAAAIEAAWSGALPPTPRPEEGRGLGVALRLLAPDRDRGFLALYRGVADPAAAVAYCAAGALVDPRYRPVSAAERGTLRLELSVFGPWREMAGPLDFQPGLDSLLLVEGDSSTILLASVAVQRGYDRRKFLSRLSDRAGLGVEGWTRPGLRFLRSATLFSLKPLAALEAGAGAGGRR